MDALLVARGLRNIYGGVWSVEQLAKGSAQGAELELLKNLWQLLYAATHRKDLADDKAKLIERTNTLRQELHRLQQDTTRRTAALHARAQELLMDLIEAHNKDKERQRILADFQSIFEKSKGITVRRMAAPRFRARRPPAKDGL